MTQRYFPERKICEVSLGLSLCLTRTGQQATLSVEFSITYSQVSLVRIVHRTGNLLMSALEEYRSLVERQLSKAIGSATDAERQDQSPELIQQLADQCEFWAAKLQQLLQGSLSKHPDQFWPQGLFT